MRIKVIAKADKSGFIDSSDVKVLNAETGEPIDHIRRVEFVAEVDDVILLKLELYPCEIEVDGALSHLLFRNPRPEPDLPGHYRATALTDAVHKFKPIPAPPSEG